MKNQQTYEEAVLKTVMWWSGAIQKPMNQDNGDKSEGGVMSFMLMTMAARGAQESITPEKIKVFEDTLADSLRAVEREKFKASLDVDYHPNEMLAKAAKKAEIETSAFPCKTWSQINKNNEVEVSMGYGTVPKII